jgi:hypothetical protein
MGIDLLERERRTVSAMLRLYCAAHHGRPLCPDCGALEAYAHDRIARCRFARAKPVCSLCPVPCYRSAEREGIRAVMRWAGPRMLVRHPALALRHLLHRARGLRGRPSS